MKYRYMAGAILVGLIAMGKLPADDELKGWKSRLTLYASFDGMADANLAVGNKQIYTANNTSRSSIRPGLPESAVGLGNNGLWGQCLRFQDTTDEVVMFRGQGNVPYEPSGFGMTLSFWLRLNPEIDLKPGYVDPLQITDKQWNNASLFVDFTQDDQPRHFRLGVFSDYAFWNPHDTPWDKVGDQQRPMVTVRKTPFASDRWTHVAITLDGINAETDNAVARLYLNGRQEGDVTRPQRFSWDPQQVAIMLGIKYIGDLDELAFFRGAMNQAQITALHQLPTGIASLP